MTLFYWNPQLETGNALVDAQHKHLFELTNRLADIVGGNGRLPEVAPLVDELMTYAAEHFCAEERLFCKARLSTEATDRHICAHRRFVTRVSEIAARDDLGQAEVVSEFLEFLVNWLVSHIMQMDRRLVRALPHQRPSDLAESFPSVERVLVSALIETDRRFRLIAEQAPVLIWFSGPSGVRDFVNKGWSTLLGVPEGWADALAWAEFIHPEDQARYSACLAHLSASREPGEIEYRVRDSGGAWCWLLERIIPRLDGDRFIGLIAAATDITVMKRLTENLEREVADRTEQLEILARTDPLTGLLNRRAFEERLQSEIALARSGGRPLAMLYVDADRFKRINDDYGHGAGDAVLAGIAATLRTAARPVDHLARIGGEEFVLLMPGADETTARKSALEILTAMPRVRFRTCPESITLSIGLTCLAPGDTGDRFMQRADQALLRAKRGGRNRIAVLPRAKAHKT